MILRVMGTMRAILLLKPKIIKVFLLPTSCKFIKKINNRTVDIHISHYAYMTHWYGCWQKLMRVRLNPLIPLKIVKSIVAVKHLFLTSSISHVIGISDITHASISHEIQNGHGKFWSGHYN